MKNLEKQNIIDKLYKTGKVKDKNIYSALAKTLEKPTRNQAKVNISKINKLDLKEGSIIIVPGKVLGDEQITKKYTVFAYSYSESAKKILGNLANSLVDFCNQEIDYSKTRIIK